MKRVLLDGFLVVGIAALLAACASEAKRDKVNDGADASSETAQAAPASKRPKDAKQFGGHWYKLYEPDPMISWHEAKKKCEEMGGYLAVIETEKEAFFIADLCDGVYAFLGATDEKKEGDWKWVNGAPWKFTFWMEGQPNNYDGVENYLATYDHGDWVDVAASGDSFWMPTAYVCEWEK